MSETTTTILDDDARQAAPTEPSQTEPETQPETPSTPAPGAETTSEPPPEKPALSKEELAERALRKSFAERRLFEQQLKEARDEIARLKPPRDPNAPPTPAEIDRMVDQRAQAKLDMQEAESRKQAWLVKGDAEVPDFTAKCNALADMGAADNGAFMTALGKVSDGHKVIAELAANPVEAARILALPPIDVALEIAALSSRITAAPPPPPRPVSKAPDPIRPIETAPRAEPTLANLDGDDFLKAWRKRKAG